MKKNFLKDDYKKIIIDPNDSEVRKVMKKMKEQQEKNKKLQKIDPNLGDLIVG